MKQDRRYSTLLLICCVASITMVVVQPAVAAEKSVHAQPVAIIALLDVPAQRRPNKLKADRSISYEDAFRDLYEVLGRRYPCFELKQIDWPAVGQELLPRAEKVQTDQEFALLCLELVARLQDSHANLQPGAISLPRLEFPRWDPGLACLIDDRGKPVVYFVDPGGPAAQAGITPGMTVLSVNDKPADEAIQEFEKQMSQYVGFSSARYLRYQAARMFLKQLKQGAEVRLKLADPQGTELELELPATMDVRYFPRLPVPHAGIKDAANVSWTKLPSGIGYIYVRRIRQDLIPSLDRAVKELGETKGLIIDVRGNTGGGFDSRRAHLNFALDRDGEDPARPRYRGPMAVLIDARCISAGEGWASWFIAQKRARFFGQATAGASARKTVYKLKNNLFQVRFPVKAYRGFLDRLIESRGLEPDVPVMPQAQDIANGQDTVLNAAQTYLLELE